MNDRQFHKELTTVKNQYNNLIRKVEAMLIEMHRENESNILNIQSEMVEMVMSDYREVIENV